MAVWLSLCYNWRAGHALGRLEDPERVEGRGERLADGFAQRMEGCRGEGSGVADGCLGKTLTTNPSRAQLQDESWSQVRFILLYPEDREDTEKIVLNSRNVHRLLQIP